LFWEWIVGRGRKLGRELGPDYHELHYEDLVEKPRETLSRVGEFVGQPMDYDRIQQVGIGSVSEPNSSFSSDPAGGFHPVRRWAEKMTPEQLADFEALTGRFLEEVGYPRVSNRKTGGFRAWRLRYSYRSWFAARHCLKSQTPLGRLAGIGRMGITDPPA
jgi:hypothetical protein